jgi:hypothetical protein
MNPEREALVKEGAEMGLSIETLKRTPTYRIREMVLEKSRKSSRSTASLSRTPDDLQNAEPRMQMSYADVAPPNDLACKIQRYNELRGIVHDLTTAQQKNRELTESLAGSLDPQDFRELQASIDKMEMQRAMGRSELDALKVSIREQAAKQLEVYDRMEKDLVDTTQTLKPYFRAKMSELQKLLTSMNGSA